jgi:hypothetical protein
MSTQTAAAPTLVLGGWTPYHNLTPADKQVFDQAIKGLVGVKYTPQTVSTQVVAGTNYRYRCLASIPPADVVWEAIVEIFKPLKGDPYVTGIIRL